ncbi:hypothetical protein AOC10_01760 [Polynucleobacter asymbioticus]|nr:hypothetical protein AOC10_01760 [Polynucleobacter asymbioticus]
MPTLGRLQSEEVDYYHIVQTDKEEALVSGLGGKVVLNMQSVVREALKNSESPRWSEPKDMREVTGFSWSAVQSDRYLPKFAPEIRARIAGALQQAVEKLFALQHFDGFLSEPVALFITHLVFYYCCKNGTRPLLWCNTYYSGYFYFADKIEISNPVRAQPLRMEDAIALRESVAAYAHNVVGDRAGPVYHHAFSGIKHSRLGYLKQRSGRSPLVLRPGMMGRLIQVARLVRAMQVRLSFPNRGDFMTAGAIDEHQFYLRCLFAPASIYDQPPYEYSAENLVYPLQYEPEASLLYFAPHHVDQVSYVETILRALPHGKILWVKEHPNQFGALNEMPWRNMKKRYENLRFVHGRQNGRELIKKSALVVTISSTMGLDALLLGRKVLVGGDVFYSRFTGAIRTESYLVLARELNRLANYEGLDSFDANVRELTEFGHNAYSGDPQPSHYLFSNENLMLLQLAIKAELSSTQKEGIVGNQE